VAEESPDVGVGEGGKGEGESGARRKRSVWAGLLWSEWFAHSRLLLMTLLGWLLTVWFLPLLVHPLWVLAYGLCYAAVAGPAFGGADVIHGCEEFSFSLPVTRCQRYWARVLMGGGGLLLVSLMDVLALEGNLSDVLLRVFVTSGLPAVPVNPTWVLYGLVVAVPAAVFALSFSLAALASSRTVAFTAWVWGVLGALVVLRGGVQLEELRFERPNGWFSVPFLTLVTAGSLWLGARRYATKEAGTGGGPLRMPPGWWWALGALVVAGAAVALLIAWFATNFSRLL
jgi:hypothetical protein